MQPSTGRHAEETHHVSLDDRTAFGQITLHTFRFVGIRRRKSPVHPQQAGRWIVEAALIGDSRLGDSLPCALPILDPGERRTRRRQAAHSDRSSHRQRPPAAQQGKTKTGQQADGDHQSRSQEPPAHEVPTDTHHVREVQNNPDGKRPNHRSGGKERQPDAGTDGRQRNRIASEGILQVEDALANELGRRNSGLELGIRGIRKGKAIVEKREQLPRHNGHESNEQRHDRLHPPAMEMRSSQVSKGGFTERGKHDQSGVEASEHHQPGNAREDTNVPC